VQKEDTSETQDVATLGSSFSLHAVADIVSLYKVRIVIIATPSEITSFFVRTHVDIVFAKTGRCLW